MDKSPNYRRVGHQVIHRDQIRRQLAAEVQQLVSRIERVKEGTRQESSALIDSYEAMIQDRCQVLARLTNSRLPC